MPRFQTSAFSQRPPAAAPRRCDAGPITRRVQALGLGLGLAAVLGLAAPAAHAQGQQAHTHGHVELGIAVEGPAIVIEMRTPLDSVVGFERPPRNDVEKNTVDQALARLRAADHLFRIDPAGACKLGPVTLDAPVLGLSSAPAPAAPPTPAQAPKEAHAELLGSFAFNCTAAEQVKFIELDLFKAFPAIRHIDAEVVTAEGQHKRTLRPPATRLNWTP